MDDLTAERFRPAESERPKRASALKVLAEIEQRRRVLLGKDEATNKEKPCSST